MHDKHILDIIGAIFAFISTVYYIKADKLAWPFGLVAICINAFLYYQTGIYGDMSLEFIYFISTFYGWYQWTHGGNKRSELPIRNISPALTLKLIIIATVGITIAHFILVHYTNSKVPLLDATTTVLSLIAQWLICKKYIQCWFLWFIVDALYVGLYFYKGIPAHSVLLVVYLGMAVVGFMRWKKLYSSHLVCYTHSHGTRNSW